MTENELLRDIGGNIESILDENNLTRQWLVNETGIDKSTISKIINGKTSTSIKNLVNIAHVLAVDVSEFVFSDEFIE